MLPLIAALLPIASNVLDRVLPDTVEKDKVKAELQRELLNQASVIEKAAANIVLAEANGDSWLQRYWRPLLMCLFGYIIAHNYVIAPLFSVPYVEMPPPLWDLLKIGIGGYVVSRGAEKGLKTWKDK